jgi:hypothetical protein
MEIPVGRYQFSTKSPEKAQKEILVNRDIIYTK